MAGKAIKETIHAKGFDISIYTNDFENEFISLTDIARYKSESPHDVVKNWLRNRETIEFLGIWESLHNPNFKQVEFDLFRGQAGLNAFTMSPTKWIEGVNAIGIVTKSGRYGGTFAHSDIAFEFASWISAEFKLYIIKDYKRLKSDENSRLSLGWNLNREIAKLNYRIHTDAIKGNLIPPELTSEQISYTYASEADADIIFPGHNADFITAGRGKEVKKKTKCYIHTNDGMNGVASYLNSHGYTKKLRQNGTIPGFSYSFVKGILDNPVYAGKIAYGRRRTEKKIGTRNEMHVVEQSEFPVYEGQHEAIISEEDWNLAQEKRKANSYKREKINNPEHAHILSGILKCPCCGKGMYGNIAKAHSKGKKLVTTIIAKTL